MTVSASIPREAEASASWASRSGSASCTDGSWSVSKTQMEGLSCGPRCRSRFRFRRGMLRVLLADDHSIVRRGMRSLLETDASIEVIAEAADGLEAVRLCEEHHPD